MKNLKNFAGKTVKSITYESVLSPKFNWGHTTEMVRDVKITFTDGSHILFSHSNDEDFPEIESYSYDANNQ